MANGNKTFIRITNRDIYDELQELKKTITNYDEKNSTEHATLKGNLRVNNWISTAAISLATAIATLLIAHLWGI